MPGEQRLVRGDHVLAVVDRLQHERAGVGLPADQLHHDVDAGALDDVRRVGDELDALEGDLALLGEVARARRRHHDVAPRPARDLLAVAAQDLDRAAADRAEAEQADVDGLQENLIPVGAAEIFLSKWKDVTVIPSRK